MNTEYLCINEQSPFLSFFTEYDKFVRLKLVKMVK